MRLVNIINVNSSISASARRHFWLGFGLAILGTGLFSIKSILIKLLYLQGLDADRVLVWRMLLAAPVYLLILLWLHRSGARQHQRLSPPELLKVLGLGFLGYYLASLLDLMGLELISAQLERLTLFTYPFFVAIIGWLLFQQSFTRHLLISLLVCYLGIVLVMWQELELTGNNVLLGTLLVLGAALSFSFYVLLARPWIRRLGSTRFTSLAMLASSLLVVLHGAITLPSLPLRFSTEAWLLLAALALFSTVIPSFMMTRAIDLIGPAKTSVVGTLGPIFTMGLAIAWLQEAFTPLMGLGAAMVILGVVWLSLERSSG